MLYWRGGELQCSGFIRRVDRKHKKWKHKKTICSVQDVNGLGKKEKKKDRERKKEYRCKYKRAAGLCCGDRQNEEIPV